MLESSFGFKGAPGLLPGESIVDECDTVTTKYFFFQRYALTEERVAGDLCSGFPPERPSGSRRRCQS
jgi:hypothetical protein